MKVINSGIFQPTTLTMLSGLTIIVATTLALGSIAQDQSGQSTAMVSSSFRAETGASNTGIQLIAFDQKETPTTASEYSPLAGPIALSFGEVKDEVSPARKFSRLLSELERIAGFCAVGVPFREVRIDVFNADIEYATSLINQATASLNDAKLLSSRDSLRLEIQTWAASPTQSGWMHAVREARRLQGKIDDRLCATGSRLYETTSSAALWPHVTRLRPAMTIVLRVPVP